MRPELLIVRLHASGLAIRAAAATVSEEEARWKPPSGAWSVLEILGHLLDEEREDFRARIESTLRDPEAQWTPINPEAAAKERAYNQRNLEQTVQQFVEERQKSVDWLKRQVETADWGSAYKKHPIGELTAGQLLACWAAHDALHLRQIAKRLYDLAGRDAEGHSLAYAGAWSD